MNTLTKNSHPTRMISLFLLLVILMSLLSAGCSQTPPVTEAIGEPATGLTGPAGESSAPGETSVEPEASSQASSEDPSGTSAATDPAQETTTSAPAVTTTGAPAAPTAATPPAPTAATTAATTQAPAVTTTSAPPTTSLSITNWTLTPQGQILWYDPAPTMIAYSATKYVTVTIPEGYTLVDICKLLEKKGVQTFYHTFSAALSGDYPSYAFTDASRNTANRRYALEGYLFPDTYQFHVGEKPANIWAKFLAKSNAVLSSYNPYPGMTMDQVITLASLIEEEAFTGETRTNVSSVLHNRLKAGKKLELDKTINYVEWYIKPLIQSTDSATINAYNSFYNTYKCPALPAGPITNPGRLAIEAALNPAATDYLYFVTDAAGNYYYATTWEEHQANLVTAGLA